jgi:cyclomaltodextrinase / maltogenic alpha-amylase / neopullulanase
MDTPAWVTDSVFYEIFPDRFARSARLSKSGLNLESWESPPTLHGFKGGDLYGVMEHLDYLRDLGIDALYLTPIFASASNHRYHTYDYFNVDPLLGGNRAFGELLDAAHGRGMRIVLDGVFNHASRGFWQFHHTLENAGSSPYVDWFHFEPERLARRRHWGAYPSPDEDQAIRNEGTFRAIGYQGWWDMPALPKFNTGAPAVREFLFGVAEHWTKFGADGWRLDVPGEINDDSFWQEFRRRVRAMNPEAYIVGEIWHDARRWLQGDQFDASMNYLLTAACLSFFPGKNLDLDTALRVGGFQGQVQVVDARGFAERIDGLLDLYQPDVTRVQLCPLDTHDTPRFLTCARGDLASLRLALTFLLTFPGAPCLYYGDEIGLEGGYDPDCRRAFVWSEQAQNQEILDFTRGLIELRHQRRDLRWGEFRTLHADGGVYAFERRLEHQSTATILNAGDAASELTLDTLGAGPAPRILAGEAQILGMHPLRVLVPARSSAVVSLDGAAAQR